MMIFIFLLLFIVSSCELYAIPIAMPPWIHLFSYVPETSRTVDKDALVSPFLFGFTRHGKKTHASSGGRTLATLFFGADSFSLNQAFPAEQFEPVRTVDFTPKISWSERGAFFGTQYRALLNKSISYFFSVGLPILSAHTTLKTPTNQFPIDTPELINQLFQFRTSEVSGNEVQTYAFRFDALTQLPLIRLKDKNDEQSLVSLFDQTFTPPGISVAGFLVTDAPGVNTPVTVANTTQTEAPEQFFLFHNTASSLPVLASVGGNIKKDGFGRFGANIDYSLLSEPAALTDSLWMIPTLGTQGALNQTAAQIRQTVSQLIVDAEQSIPALLATEFDLSLRERTRTGLGDLIGRGGFEIRFSSNFVQSYYLLLQLPTGARIEKRQILQPPLGNSGHVEGGFGTIFFFGGNFPFSFYGDYGFTHAFSRTEHLAIPLRNTKLPLIGPLTDVNISWNSLHAIQRLSWSRVYKNNRFSFALLHQWYRRLISSFRMKHLFESERVLRNPDARRALMQQRINEIHLQLAYDREVDSYELHLTLGYGITVLNTNAVSERGWFISAEVSL